MDAAPARDDDDDDDDDVMGAFGTTTRQ